MQLTVAERNRIHILMRVHHMSSAPVTKLINAARAKAGRPHVHLSTISRFARGMTHVEGRAETRGRKRSLTGHHIRHLDRTRYRLIRSAANNYMITYQQIIKEADLEGIASLRTCAGALRKLGVRFRAPRQKIGVTEKDAQARYKLALKWSKRPRSYWSKCVQAYVVRVQSDQF